MAEAAFAKLVWEDGQAPDPEAPEFTEMKAYLGAFKKFDERETLLKKLVEVCGERFAKEAEDEEFLAYWFTSLDWKAEAIGYEGFWLISVLEEDGWHRDAQPVTSLESFKLGKLRHHTDIFRFKTMPLSQGRKIHRMSINEVHCMTDEEGWVLAKLMEEIKEEF